MIVIIGCLADSVLFDKAASTKVAVPIHAAYASLARDKASHNGIGKRTALKELAAPAADKASNVSRQPSNGRLLSAMCAR